MNRGIFAGLLGGFLVLIALGEPVAACVLTTVGLGAWYVTRSDPDTRERQFRTLAESIPQLAWMAKPNGDIFWYNRRWYDYTGTTFAQMQGWGWQTVHNPDVLPTVLERWKASIALGQTFDMTFPLKGRDGRFRPFLTRVEPVKDSAGRVRRWFGTNTDITETERIAEELKAERERLAFALAGAELGQWTLNLVDHTANGTTRHDQIFGYDKPPASWSYERILEHVVPEQRATVDAQFREAIASGTTWNLECRIRRADGSERHIWSKARPRRDADGRVNQMLGIIGDQTDRIQAEQARDAADLRTAATLESIGEGFVAVDANWRYTYVNSRAETIQNMRREEIIGRSLWEVFPDILGSEFEREYRRAMVDRVHVRVEGPFDRLGGWFVVNVFPIAGDGLSFYFHDISKQKLAERAAAERMAHLTLDAEIGTTLTSSESLPKMLQACATSLVRNLDAAFARIWTVNESLDMLELKASAGLYTHIDGPHARIPVGKFKIGRIAQRREPHLTNAVQGDPTVPEQEWARREGIVAFAGYPLVVADRLVGVVALFARQTLNDTTLSVLASAARGIALGIERKAMENRLRQLIADLSEADRRKDEFLATLAHELRNPLAPLRTGLQLLRLNAATTTPAEEARTMMERQVTQLVRLVDDLMDVSRITRGKLELRKERASLAMIVSSAIETSRPLIEQMGHRLTLRLPERPVYVDADVTRLAQVFTNLLNNAAKYGDRDGQITLTAEVADSEVAVSVADTGIGIPADKLTSIFDLFSQVDRSLEKAQGGLGIGLTLVKQISEMHGGTIRALSAGPGHGSEFIVRLPLATEVEPVVSNRESPVEVPLRSSFRILIIDDNRDGADSLELMLGIMGNTMRTAYDGREGIEIAEEFRPEVVLCDIGLPRLNGYEVCRLIRRETWGQEIVLIAVTGWGQEDDRRRSREAGFDHHWVKPVDPQALMELLAAMPARRAGSAGSASRPA